MSLENKARILLVKPSRPRKSIRQSRLKSPQCLDYTNYCKQTLGCDSHGNCSYKKGGRNKISTMSCYRSS